VIAFEKLRPVEIPFLEIPETLNYDWKSPKGWNKDWPADPVFIPPEQQRCDL
jgi:hypothetical protein